MPQYKTNLEIIELCLQGKYDFPLGVVYEEPSIEKMLEEGIPDCCFIRPDNKKEAADREKRQARHFLLRPSGN